MRGKFISFEGPEGGGKSTHVAALAEALVALAEALLEAALDELLDVQPNRPRAATSTPANASAAILLTFMVIPFFPFPFCTEACLRVLVYTITPNFPASCEKRDLTSHSLVQRRI